MINPSSLKALPDGLVTFPSLLKWAVKGARADIIIILGIGFLIGLIRLLVPILTGILFDFIVPSASYSHLWFWGGGVLTIGISVACLKITQFMYTAQLSQSIFNKLQVGLMARLISLPITFFHKFSPGELATRALGIDRIQENLTNSTIVSFFSSFFSVFNLLLLFYYSVKLAIITCVLILIYGCGLAVVYFFYLRALKKEKYISGQLVEQVYEILNGISKIRISGGEERFFNRWLDQLNHQIVAIYGLNRLATMPAAFRWFFRFFVFSTIFYVITESVKINLSIGQLIAFIMALLLFCFAILNLVDLGVTFLKISAYYRGIKPILTEASDIKEGQAQVKELQGRIELLHVSFHYAESIRQTLFDISLQIEPGEFIAIVGRSGAGKSTLLRLLIGLESPKEGSVFYDGQDLNTLNAATVRSHCGVVLQNDRLFPGSILDNIIGTNALTLDDALAAVRLSGILEDIKAMPMGMQTLVSETAGLSGGQKQRILIARALVRKPSILFFDEATSALDNISQEIVAKSLDSLKLTRFVVAQRLSTIKNADRIYVLDKGHLVQSGKFDELMKEPGIFSEMAQRQLI
jgi:NHLM bacteriocin system ABC transporter ATP-binding protein